MTDPSASSSSSLAPASEVPSGSNPSQPRSTRTEAETWVLIRLWEDQLSQLRGEKRNEKYMTPLPQLFLAQSGIRRTRRQVQTKIDNLTQRYRQQQQCCPQERKRQSATETFRNNLLEPQNKLIATLLDATKIHQALRER
ncbi:hypothetical protein HPB49_009403 [Dermacentor silvarum]|uniref:Uncharacterized protein n=1 Tax=Dermacentor silvarum TaxID=543639 RepID=A0ACB8CQW8_DERSI|nr:hypothetical protein HPB49_009403 [Dermacentor silvarum]